MIEDIIFETKGSNQCEIKLQHSTGETTTLLFNSTFPLQAQEYYLKAIQLLQKIVFVYHFISINYVLNGRKVKT